jgi:hypothetical protein
MVSVLKRRSRSANVERESGFRNDPGTTNAQRVPHVTVREPPVPTAPTQRAPEVIRFAALVGWLAAVIGGVGGSIVVAGTGVSIPPNIFGLGPAGTVAFAVQAITFASIGVLLVRRQPDNAVGWVLVVCGTAYALSILAGVLASVAALEAPRGHAASVAAWLGVVLSFVGAASLPYLAFIFPTGRAHSPRWERVRKIVLGVSVVMAIGFATQPGPTQIFPGITNPFGVGPELRVLFGKGALLIVTGVGGAVYAGMAIFAVVSRYRAAAPVERQQLKWFISAALASLAAFAITSWSVLQPNGLLGELPIVACGLTGSTVPIAIGIAILRYRLYEIDRLIGRTLTYGAVTAVLAGIYAAIVVGIGALAGSLAQGSTLAVAAATLTVFALFGPVRRRVQQAIDRRFDRARFDAAQLLLGAADRLRNEVDPERIERDVIGVLREAFHPVHASVWMRGRPGHQGPR